MDNIKIKIVELLDKGFATQEERTDLIEDCSTLETEEVGEIREDLEKVEAMPLEKEEPETLEKEEEKEIPVEGEKLSRSERRRIATERNTK